MTSWGRQGTLESLQRFMRQWVLNTPHVDAVGGKSLIIAVGHVGIGDQQGHFAGVGEF